MPKLFYVTLTALFALLFMTGAGSMAAAQGAGQTFVKDDPTAQISKAKVEEYIKENTPPQLTKEDFIKMANIGIFEIAVKGDLSWCKNDKNCIDDVNWIKAWPCMADACAQGGSKDPGSCIEYSYPGDKDQGNKMICNVISDPKPEARQAVMQAMPDASEDGLVEGAAYYSALKGNPGACQDQIKKYKGPYGDKWSLRWYSDLSGCRILAGKRTREEEEKDLGAWFDSRGVMENCLTIDNTEMRDACKASKGAPPPPVTISSIKVPPDIVAKISDMPEQKTRAATP